MDARFSLAALRKAPWSRWARVCGLAWLLLAAYYARNILAAHPNADPVASGLYVAGLCVVIGLWLIVRPNRYAMYAAVLPSLIVLNALVPALLFKNPSNIPIVGFVIGGLPILLSVILLLQSQWDPTYPGADAR